MPSPIASAVPGRIRVRDLSLRDSSTCARVEAVLAALPGVLSTRANRAAASIVVVYDQGEAALAEMTARVSGCLGDAGVRPREASASWSDSDNVNRYVKYAALTSLGASLSFALAGKKRLHVLTGSAFVGLLGAHLVMNRRSLLL